MAAELVGGAFLSAFLQVLFDRVASREVVDYMRGKKLNERLLKKLKITLLSVNAVLNDAEEKQFRCPLVKEWLHELKDAVYDAEDLWDEIATDALQYNLQAKSSTTVNQMKLQIEEILDRLEFIAKQKDVLGLKHGVAEKQSWKIPTSSLVEESHVYGRDDDREAIIKLLLSDGGNGNNICVIPIVGMPGIGKTTLAQVVYNDNRVKENFEFAAWICVSEDFDVCRITKTVLEAVTSVCCDFKDLNLLQLKLKEELSGKKFLLVLDDVWNENYDSWEALRRPFNSGTQGSKIIVTTRNASVASIMRTVPVHYLNQLTDEDCWLLFAKCAFGNYGNSDAHPILEGIGREIVKKCKGLPLAAKTLGCLSRFKLDAEEWDKILKSDIWEFSDDQSNILPALRLSYNYLPSHLKRCFAYCSIFPKDYAFKKGQLIQLWMAEDLLQLPKRNKRIEEVGDEYFHELVSRSFFQRSAGENSCFVMHDLINDLARFVSGELCFRLEDDNPEEISEKTRHLSYVMALEDLFKRFEIFYKAKCLRTFLPLYLPDEFYCLSNKVQHDLLIKLRCLRVLSLSNYHSISELPDSIGELIHLRYLDVSRTLIKRLPESVCTIYNLQTLKLAYCYRLRQLPTGIHNLVNLRNLDMNGTCVEEMPAQMSKLESLQMLSTFIVGKENGIKIGELGKLSNLRGTLSIKKLNNVANVMDAFEAKVKDKKYLEELVLDWGYGNTDDTNRVRYILEKLVPHKALKKLQVHNYGGTRFPHWLGDRAFCNMISVSLHDCEHCCILPPLGQLPSLKHLSIEGFDGVVIVGPEFYGNSSQPFPSLEILKFGGMSTWEEWCPFGVEDQCIEAFLHLKELRIESCPSLIGSLPKNLPSLKKLVIEYCEQIVSPLPRALAIRELELVKCDKVVLRELPHTLHSLKMKGCQFVVETLLGEISTQIQACPRRLDISDCSTLMSFPGSCLPTTLSFLSIKNCEKLRASAAAIPHIPRTLVDSK